MEYKEFKITNKIKKEIAREVKEFIRDKHYTEIGVMYNVDTEKFFTTEIEKMDRLEYEGNIKYTIFTYYGVDRKITLKEIEKNIFGC